MLPNFLFRGDDDSENFRNLRANVDHRQFQTNLLKGGDGSKIFTEELMELVNEHILSRYKTSDFLSFTDRLKSAYRFGLKLHTINQEIIDKCCEEIYDKEYWDFVLITLNTDLFLGVDVLYKGIYECQFHPHLTKFARLGYPYTVILINPLDALTEKYGTAKEYATYDNEWLVLPATKIELNFNKSEFSGVLDGGCISNVQKFVIDKDQREIYNTISYE